MSVFHRFARRLQEAIVARLGWASLRPVQEAAGEALLAGDNAVILAPTAGGKTEAAMFPVLSGLVDDPPRGHGVGALYIAPIKALLNNQATRLGLYTEMVGLERFVWHGDVGPAARRRFQREPSELLMTTPESLEVMLMSPRFDAGALFADLRVVVIDEVHALAGTDRGAHLASVLERIAALGGRAWLVAGIDHKAKQVRVTAAPRGREPSWGGMVPQLLGLEVCQRIGASLREDAVPAYLDARGRELLEERRAAVAGVLTGGGRDLEDRGESVVWWTLAGGGINTTYKHALLALGLPWRVIVDNLWIEVRGGDGLSPGAFAGWLDRLADAATWDDERLWAEIVAGLPDYRLSKFQPLMPAWASRELVAKTLLDVDGARRLIG